MDRTRLIAILFLVLPVWVYGQKISDLRYQGEMDASSSENKYTFRLVDKRSNMYLDVKDIILYDQDNKALNSDLIRGASSQAIVLLNKTERAVRAVIQVNENNELELPLEQNDNNLHTYFLIVKLKK